MSNAAPSSDNDRLRLVQSRADEVANIARQNIQLSIAQVDQLAEMETKSETLSNTAQDFNKRSTDLRWKYYWRNWKMIACILLIIAIILIIIIVPSVEANK